MSRKENRLVLSELANPARQVQVLEYVRSPAP